MKLTKKQRELVRVKFGGKCAYCGCDLPEKGWHADHVDPVLREWWVKKSQKLFRPENDRLDNIFPSCQPCNNDKHANDLETWRQIIKAKVGVCRRSSSAFRHAERFGLAVEIDKPVVFWFEQFVENSDFHPH